MDQHHGTESYYVLGEGLLTESGGGRAQTLAPEVEAQTAPFRFSRMGPSGAGDQIGEVTRRKLAAAMTTGTSPGSRIPAGFTYLGQFIDHDLTFDKHQRHARRRRLARRPAPGPLAGPRPRLAVRRRPVGSGLGPVLQRRAAPEDGQHDRERRSRDPRLRPAARRQGQRRGPPHRADPGAAQRREPGRRPDAPDVQPLPQPRRATRCRPRPLRRSSSPARGARSRSTTSG